MLEMASVIFPDYVSPLGSLYGFFWTIPEGSRVTSKHTAVSECASPLWNQWRLQNKPGQTSIPVILSAVAAPMTVQYIELAQRTHTQGHFNFLFPMKTLLKAHQLKLEDFFFFLPYGKTNQGVYCVRIRSYGNSFRACCSREESRSVGKANPWGWGSWEAFTFSWPLASGLVHHCILSCASSFSTRPLPLCPSQPPKPRTIAPLRFLELQPPLPACIQQQDWVRR